MRLNNNSFEKLSVQVMQRGLLCCLYRFEDIRRLHVNQGYQGYHNYINVLYFLYIDNRIVRDQ